MGGRKLTPAQAAEIVPLTSGSRSLRRRWTGLAAGVDVPMLIVSDCIGLHRKTRFFEAATRKGSQLGFELGQSRAML
jgi:hypothetical protein